MNRYHGAALLLIGLAMMAAVLELGSPRVGANPFIEGGADIAAGGDFTCVVTDIGGVKCWGTGGGFAEGQGLVPTSINGLQSGVASVAVAGDFACALLDVGGLKCWGENRFGSLGDGTTTDRADPVDVFGLTSGVAALAESGLCAIMAGSGGLKCWGWDNYGQLGAESNELCFITDEPCSTTPVDVDGLAAGIVQAAGSVHKCAAASSGTVSCWGVNFSGQLGFPTAKTCTFFSYPCAHAPAAVAGHHDAVSAHSDA